MRQNFRRLLRWISSLSLTGFSIVAGIYFVDLNKVEPLWMMRSLYGFGFLALIFAVLWMLVSEPKEAPVARAEGPINLAHGIGGSQLTGIGGIYGDEALKTILSQTPKAKSASEPSSPRVARLRFEHVETQKLVYVDHRGLWACSEQHGRSTVLAKVWYEFPDDQSQRSPTIQASAIIRYRERSGSYTQIDNAYWLNRSVNTCTMNVGEHGLVMLGWVDDSKWVTLNNRYSTPFITRSRGATRRKGQPIVVAGDCDGVQIELSIVDKSSGLRLGFQRYEITRSGGSDFIVEMID